MIGWKIVCTIDDKEVVAEVASQPMSLGGYPGFKLLVYHDEKLKVVFLNDHESIKVIEKK